MGAITRRIEPAPALDFNQKDSVWWLVVGGQSGIRSRVNDHRGGAWSLNPKQKGVRITMNIGRLTVAILKVVMCTVGCAIAVLLIWSINVHHINKLYFVWVLGGAIFGLCVGISWVIERKEVRTAFVVPTLFGLVIWLVLVSGSRGGPHPVYDWHMKVLVLGLLIGSVWALSRAGAFKTKQDQETA